jgi:hypothetical protein
VNDEETESITRNLQTPINEKVQSVGSTNISTVQGESIIYKAVGEPIDEEDNGFNHYSLGSEEVEEVSLFDIFASTDYVMKIPIILRF